MSRIPQFIELLDKMKATHVKKNEDYASVDSPYSNFERAALIASWFNDPVSKIFATLIGVKLARWAELENKGGKANNESIEDTKLDASVYMALWASYEAYNKVKSTEKLEQVYNFVYCKGCLKIIKDQIPHIYFNSGNTENWHKDCFEFIFHKSESQFQK